MALTLEQENALVKLLDEPAVTLNELPKVEQIDDQDLFLTRQDTREKAVTGEKLKHYFNGLDKDKNLSDVADKNAVITNLGLDGWEKGKLLNIQIFESSDIYIPTKGTKKIIVEVQGAGGAGGGAVISTASTASAGSGGMGGAYAKTLMTEIKPSYIVTIGLGGLGVAGGTGTNGGTTYFGDDIEAGGGNGGNSMSGGITQAISSPSGSYDASRAVKGANIVGVGKSYGQCGIRFSGTLCMSGSGGNTPLGSGGGTRISTGQGAIPLGYGAGGSGASCVVVGNAHSGTDGANGVVIVWEYS